MSSEKRKDSNRVVLRPGEGERKAGGYRYRWTERGVRHEIYAPTLNALRAKEAEISYNQHDDIRTDLQRIKLNDYYEIWKELKKGTIKDDTYQNYIYMYDLFVKPEFGRQKLFMIKHSTVQRFYKVLHDERGLKTTTIDTIHNVVHQILEMAVKDRILRANPADEALKELKAAHRDEMPKIEALTYEQQHAFVEYMGRSPKYSHWAPVFTVMLETGLRVGEVTGLRWKDVDFENGIIHVNHTLVYYQHSTNGSYFGINTPKTESGCRDVPMTKAVVEAFKAEKEYQKEAGIENIAVVDGYRDFIFVNRYGNVHNQSTLNAAIKRIMRDYNYEQLAKHEKNPLLLPNFSCHRLRHTFCTRMCEAKINIKVIQYVMGHKDISTTMEIYTSVNRDFAKSEINDYTKYMEGLKAKKKSDNDKIPQTYPNAPTSAPMKTETTIMYSE